MKKPISLPTSLPLRLWAVFHALILLAFLILLAAGRGIRADADLMHLMPSAGSGIPARVDESLSQTSSRNVFILARSADFAGARQLAVRLYDRLSREKRFFDSLSLFADDSSLTELADFVHEWQAALIPVDAAGQILQSDEEARAFADRALAAVYGGFSPSSFRYLDSDPYLLTDTALQNYLTALQDAGTALSPRDGVLATEFEGAYYVLIRGVLSREGARMGSRKAGVQYIYDSCRALEEELEADGGSGGTGGSSNGTAAGTPPADGHSFICSGTPFHSYESSLSASREISIISTVSLLLTLAILLAVFRTPFPILMSVLSIALSLGTAFAATLVLFGSIQLLALVFGTSLIGCGIDYSLHFFMHWRNGSGPVQRTRLRGLLFSYLSTVICYTVLLVMPFSLLRQIAVFSLAGITSAFLTSSCLFPVLPAAKRPVKEAESMKRTEAAEPAEAVKTVELDPRGKGQGFPAAGKLAAAGRYAAPGIVIISLCLLTAFHGNCRVQNSVASLYTMQGRLKDDSILSARILSSGTGSYFVIRGPSAEAVLQKEEAVCALLKARSIDRFIACSRFIPSRHSQEFSRQAADRLYRSVPDQAALLGLDEEAPGTTAASASTGLPAVPETAAVPESPEAAGTASGGERCLSPEDAASLPESLRQLIGMLWIGEEAGSFYSIILPTGACDEDACRAIAAEQEGVFFQNKVHSVNKSLDWLTRRILALFAIAFLLVLLVLKSSYSWRQTARIAAVPLVSILLILAVFAACGQRIDFFCTAGMLLVLGLGLDYVIYMQEQDCGGDGRDRTEAAAVALSFITTELSFGALAFSSFVPVHIIGLAISSGLLAAFVCTFSARKLTK